MAANTHRRALNLGCCRVSCSSLGGGSPSSCWTALQGWFGWQEALCWVALVPIVTSEQQRVVDGFNEQPAILQKEQTLVLCSCADWVTPLTVTQVAVCDNNES